MNIPPPLSGHTVRESNTEADSDPFAPLKN